MSCGIYKITNLVNGKIYVGQSVDMERRFQKHLYANDNFLIHKAIRKYGRQNFSFQILEECSQEQLNDKEILWIKTLNSMVPNGYNMIDGGSNGAGLAKGYEVIQYSLDGEYMAEYPSARQASRQTGIDHHTICDCCNNINHHAGGFQWKYKNSNKEIVPINIRLDFTVLQIDKETNEVIQEFNSIAEASKKLNIAKSTICKVCNGKGKTAGGFKWKYKNK